MCCVSAAAPSFGRPGTQPSPESRVQCVCMWEWESEIERSGLCVCVCVCVCVFRWRERKTANDWLKICVVFYDSIHLIRFIKKRTTRVSVERMSKEHSGSCCKQYLFVLVLIVREKKRRARTKLILGVRTKNVHWFLVYILFIVNHILLVIVDRDLFFYF